MTIKKSKTPPKGSKASLEKIAKGSPDKQATLAAQRVLAKREARKAGIQPITQQSTEDLNLKGTGKTTKERYGKANDNPEPKPVKKHGKVHKPELIVKYIRDDGRAVLGTAEPLPDPHTKDLKLSKDIIDDMNEWFKWYKSMPYYFKDDAERDARIREDFARYGANDKSIQLVEVLDKTEDGTVLGKHKEYQRTETRKAKKA